MRSALEPTRRKIWSKKWGPNHRAGPPKLALHPPARAIVGRWIVGKPLGVIEEDTTFYRNYSSNWFALQQPLKDRKIGVAAPIVVYGQDQTLRPRFLQHIGCFGPIHGHWLLHDHVLSRPQSLHHMGVMEAGWRENDGQINLVIVQNGLHIVVEWYVQLAFPSVATGRCDIGYGNKLHVRAGAYLREVIVLKNPAEADDAYSDFRHVRPESRLRNRWPPAPNRRRSPA